ncbi:PG0541 family transporter-associated protein [Treponema sp.]|uniref:PG0541 family transporter-associated protein n=1 Tax=Treponema sp. TaxID=166 RepID=UPI002600C393|nr:PG0541 family transporter-associated protein [Treponema sp.]MCR5217974.1 hypothetical protein [Treponema sp.]
METKKCRRVEIVCSQALEEDFTQEFLDAGVGKKFTKINPVMGAGCSNPHLGDSVWPQLNIMYIIFCSEEEAEKIYSIVVKLRKLYITEGIACFISESSEC